MNNYSEKWPKCSSSMEKNVVEPFGYVSGYYCSDDWVNSLNEMLSNSVINICGKNDRIAQVLAQVAWETGYFSNVY